MAAIDRPDELLSRLAPFRQVPVAKLAELARRAYVVHAPRGSTVLERGERPRGLMAVSSGLVKLSLKGDSEKVLRLVGPGETFAEASLMLDKPMPIEATALADSIIVMVPTTQVLALVDSDRRFARALLATLSQRLHALVADMEATTQHGARERLAAYLESLAPPGDAPASVRLPATKTVIAARLGVTKETLSRLFHQLAAEELICVAKRDITLLDRKRLAAPARAAHVPALASAES